MNPSTSLAVLTELLAEMEQEDPLNYTRLPYEQAQLRTLIASHVLEYAERLNSEGLSREDVHWIWLTTVAHLLQENLMLHLKQQGGDAVSFPEAKALLEKIWKS